MTLVEIQSTSGVLAACFATVQLAEWTPTDLARQLPAGGVGGHRHTWVQLPISSAQQQQQQQKQRQKPPTSAWQGCCKDCLCRLSVFVDTSVAGTCIDSTGHHMHSALGTTTDNASAGFDEEAHSAGTSRCCKCGLLVKLQLMPPVIDPEMVAALEDARTKPHTHHPTQGTRELIGTLSTMFRIVRNACQGNRSLIRTTSEKPRQLLKFDAPCNHILEILGFELINDTEFRPPDLGLPASDALPAGSPQSSSSSLMLRRLERARDELCVLTGRIQRKLRDVERNEAFVYRVATPELAALLGAKDYPKRPGASSLLMASASSMNTDSDSNTSKRQTVDDAYRRLGVPEDAADSLVVWSYSRLAEEDESVDPLTGALAQQRFDALVAIAGMRTSEELDSLVANERERGMTSTMQIRTACKALFGDSGYEVAAIDDDTVREMARTQIAEASTTKVKIEMAEHLRVLALAKHSEPLVNYAAVLVSELEAREASSEPAADALGHMKLQLDTWEQLPVGLNNIGNTCYLNSILQFIYSLTPIREAVMRYGDAQTWNEKLVLGRRDGGKLLTVDEIKRALRFVELLKGLFSTLINHRIESWSLADARKNSSSAVAPGHPLLAAASSSSAATSLAVSPDRELSNMLLLRITGNDTTASTGAAISISSSSTLNMQAEDDNDRAPGATTTTAATQTQQMSVPQYNQQQDVDECMAQCVTFLVHALLPEPTLHLEASANTNSTGESVRSERVHDDGSWIHRLLAGHQELSTDKLINGRRKDTEPPTTEQFVNLNLNIPREAADINDCIDAFFEPSVVPGSSDEQRPTSSQMMDVDVPEQQQKHVELVRHTRIKDAPPVLCIQLQRVQFDVTTMRSYKLNSHVRLRSQISLAPYMQFSHRHCETEDKEQWRRRRHQIKDRLTAIDRHLRVLETPVRAKSSGSDAMASMSVVSALERVQAFMSGVGSWSEMEAAKELLSDLGKPADTIVQEARQLSSDLGFMAQALGGASEKWRDERKALCAELDSIYDNVPIDESAYTLHAVFIHSGLSPEYGHYWVYVRDHDKAKNQTRWLCFNDSDVSVVDESAVFNDSPLPGQDTANPYYLVYVRTRDLDGTVNFGV